MPYNPEIANSKPQLYRYAFQGQERDDEVKGAGNSYDFGARMLDSRLGRWLSIDPRMDKYPFTSPYTSMGNNPLLFTDPGGDTIVIFLGDDPGKNFIKQASQSYVKNQVDDGVFMVFSHGNPLFVSRTQRQDGSRATINGESAYQQYNNSEDLIIALSEISPEFKQAAKNKRVIHLILTGCNTGVEPEEFFGEDHEFSKRESIAKTISKDNPYWIVKAPSGRTRYNINKKTGKFELKGVSSKNKEQEINAGDAKTDYNEGWSYFIFGERVIEGGDKSAKAMSTLISEDGETKINDDEPKN